MANDFIINTQKHCFLCFTEIDHSLSHLNHSIQHLSNLLKLDRRKVLSENGAVPKQSVTKVAESRFMVKLCRGCATWNKSFSEKCQQLEKIRLEVFSKLNALQEVMPVGNDDKAERWRANKYLDKNSIEDLTENELRNHVIQRCAYMLRTDCPRVKIRKLTTRELPPKRKMNSNPTHIINFDAEIFEQNKEVAEEFTNDDFFNNLETSEESPSPKEADAENEIDIKPDVLPPTRQTGNSTRLIKFRTPALIKQLITTKPDRHECSICHKEFSHPRSIYNHVKSAHLLVRFKCRICYKDFTSRNTLRDHHRRFHNGECIIENDARRVKPNRTVAEKNILNNTQEGHSSTKYAPPSSSSTVTTSKNIKKGSLKCSICKIAFNSQATLRYHSRRVHLKLRFSCPSCPKQFMGETPYYNHYKSAHMGLRHLCTGCNQTFSQAGHLRRHKQKNCCRQRNRKRK